MPNVLELKQMLEQALEQAIEQMEDAAEHDDVPRMLEMAGACIRVLITAIEATGPPKEE